MKKAAGIILALFALAILQYYGFSRPVIIQSIPTFFDSFSGSTSLDFAFFLTAFGDVLFSISIIFLCFGIMWVAFDMFVSKDKEFRLVISKNTLVFLAVGGGLFFGSEFAQAFSRLMKLMFIEALLYALVTLAALEFTITILKYLKIDAPHFFLSIKLSQH
ncbi:MAG: hypothetical protein V1835_06730 [Candidatus Micrarchaeota archaeon]